MSNAHILAALASGIKGALLFRVFDHPTRTQANARLIRYAGWSLLVCAFAVAAEFVPH